MCSNISAFNFFANKDKKLYLKAKAWHDHGHENNPRVPRWEDTRKSSGFNFRMSELQGAIGLAQLKKFNEIFERHQKNKNLILSKIKSFDNFKIREIPLFIIHIYLQFTKALVCLHYAGFLSLCYVFMYFISNECNLLFS